MYLVGCVIYDIAMSVGFSLHFVLLYVSLPLHKQSMLSLMDGDTNIMIRTLSMAKHSKKMMKEIN